jgi:hypothetical protein
MMKPVRVLFLLFTLLLLPPRLPAQDDAPNGDYGGFYTWI